MSRAAISVFAWGIYMLLMGFNAIIVPNLTLQILGMPPTNEIWIRVVGMFSIILGYFYIRVARYEFLPLFRWKVEMHIFGVICMVTFVVLRLASPAVLMLASADFIAAIWTGLALKYPRQPVLDNATVQ